MMQTDGTAYYDGIQIIPMQHLSGNTRKEGGKADAGRMRFFKKMVFQKFL